MLQKIAIKTIGADISKSNSKMGDSTAYGISATKCHTGQKLTTCDGSVCSKCYALRIEKMRPSVHQGYIKRWDAVINNTGWVDAFVIRLNKVNKSGFHRWHDSGDIQSSDHLHKIVSVARKTPHIKHWLPTKESKIVREYFSNHSCPKNLVVRISSPMIDQRPVTTIKNSIKTSTVHTKGNHQYGFECPAPKQGNKCGDCKACWSSKVNNVSYKKH